MPFCDKCRLTANARSQITPPKSTRIRSNGLFTMQFFSLSPSAPLWVSKWSLLLVIDARQVLTELVCFHRLRKYDAVDHIQPILHDRLCHGRNASEYYFVFIFGRVFRQTGTQHNPLKSSIKRFQSIMTISLAAGGRLQKIQTIQNGQQ